MALAARQRRGQAVQRQVAHAHVAQVFQTVVDFGKQALGNQRIGLAELQVAEPLQQVLYRHSHQLADGHAAHLDKARLRLQSCAMACGANGLAAVACLQHAELDGIGFALYPLKEAVDAAPLTVSRAVPQQVELLL